MSYRLGILVSHPIQYYTPWFRALAKRLDLVVFYAHQQDAAGQAQAGFGVEFEWDIPLLEGYRYRWLSNIACRPSVNAFSGCDTPELYDIIRSDRFDAFLIFGWYLKSSLQAIRACWQNNVPVLMRGDSQLTMERLTPKRLVKYLPYRWFLPRLAAHLYVGRRNKAYLRHYGVPQQALFFAPHAVDNQFFSARAKEAKAAGEDLVLRDKFQIPRDAFLLLFVGKFIPKKRPSDFVQAYLRASTSANGSQIHAILVGDGPLSIDLQTLAQPGADRIRFAGFRNQSELPAFYAAADALILPSDGRETWGLTVNEAMACGVPAIVSDAVGCSPDLIDEGETGYTYPLGDVDSLADCILALKQLCENEQAAIRQALADKMAQYSIERATAGLEEALEATVGQTT